MNHEVSTAPQQQMQNNKRLSLILKRQLSLQKEELLHSADAFVEEHLPPDQKLALSNNQLNNLENIAYTTSSPPDVIHFLRSQVAKEKPQGWDYAQIGEHLIDKVNDITGGGKGNNPSRSGRVIAAIDDRAQEAPPVPEAYVTQWLSKDRQTEIKMALIRNFVSYVTAYYALQRGKLPQTAKGQENA